jgi:hypothetical protein
VIFRRWLVSLAGARHDLLAKTPVDRFRYTATAGVLLTTAAIAAVSATFALIMAVRLPVPVAAVAGLGWGVVILNLDRLLTIGMNRHTGLWRSVVAALPRLALAILLGTVISTPLVLRIFQPEIETELGVLQDQHKAAFQQQQNTDPQFAAIPGLESQLAKLQATANQDPNAVAATNPAVLTADKNVADAKATYEAAQQAVECEIDGSCGTHLPGIGNSAAERQSARDNALDAYNKATAAQTSAQNSARAAAIDSSRQANQDATRIQTDLTNRRKLQTDEQNAFNTSASQDSGLLSRIEALGALGNQRPDLRLAQVVLFLLFLSIEVLPVVVKLLQLAGPPTVYDQLIDQLEKSAKRAEAKAVAREENINDDYAELQADLEHNQASLQFDAGLQANRLLVAEQSAIAERAIRRWAEEAQRRSDDGLAQWFNHHPGPNGHDTANGAPHPAEQTMPLPGYDPL